MLGELVVYKPQDINSCITACLPGCYSSLLSVLLQCLQAPDLDQVLQCELLNWHETKWWCHYTPNIFKLQIHPRNSTFTSFLRGTEQPPSPGAGFILQQQQTRSLSSAVQQTGEEIQKSDLPQHLPNPKNWSYKSLDTFPPWNLKCWDIYLFFLYTHTWRCHSLSSFTEKYSNICAENKGN